ncbi:cobalamin synthesis protein P47K [Thermosediminibacter oceani DSM 16646]|uniref:Cobalamin synthesis protein P47K n=2 Tax=Thermosediminibacter TaxID=291988 RepID=D9RZU5_THEOJ|nr:cyclic 2,3-diphosphoglycerate synthase [Thermosediminibacter oceani]ADL08722.1 cobalamin synthesis protein P47K [Thermosediminibacter oceani DSM 16646]
MKRIRTIIMGAAGRDFHVFNTYFRDNELYEVVAFTATQIPNIEGRKYPADLAGRLYPDGIPIYPESRLEELIKELGADQVIFAYSDVSHEEVMHKASRVLSAGADFRLMGPKSTMIKSTKPVVSICAVRTGVGKSQTTRRVCQILKDMGKKVVAIRHPMPYGDLSQQVCQRFATYEDLDRHKCTIEEREEYEPHIDMGIVVYAGVDYGVILKEAEKEADIIVWDGGNNDFPFYNTDLHIVLVDPHRPGHEVKYHPGETNLRMADVVVINKIDTASSEGIDAVRRSIEEVNPGAQVVEAASPIFVEDPAKIKGKRVLVVEDGPTLTHGEMTYGAGYVAAKKYGAAEIVDPRPYAVGSIKDTYAKYNHLSVILPAMGYGDVQVKELEETINRADCDTVIIGTPIDLSRITKLNKPTVRVRYKLQEIGTPTLEDVLRRFR